MSPKIESSRPPQLSRPEAPSQVSPAVAKERPAPSAAPRPISDGFSREASSAAAQASRGALLEGAGTPLARDPRTSAPTNTGVDQEPYHLGLGMEGGGTPSENHDAAELTSATDLLKVRDLPGPIMKLFKSEWEKPHNPGRPMTGDSTAPPSNDTGPQS
jgi:hypothetical protein